MGLLDTIVDVLSGPTTWTSLDGVGPYIGYLERLDDEQRWLVSVVVGVGDTFPALDDNFVDLTGNGQADVGVQVGVSMTADVTSPSIDRAKVRISRETTQDVPGFRLVVRADGQAVMPSDDSSTDDIPFVYIEFGDENGTVDFPETTEVTAAPRGLDTDDQSTWVPRGCATDPWPRATGEPDGQQIDLDLDIEDGAVPTQFEGGLIVDGQTYTPSGPNDVQIASTTRTPYLPQPAGTDEATFAAPKGVASELQQFDIAVQESTTPGSRTDLTLGTCLWRELVAGSNPGLLGTQTALSFESSDSTDIDLYVTSRDDTAETTVELEAEGVPTEIHARTLPSRREANPGPTGADGQDSWIGYDANGVLDRLEVDVLSPGESPIWLYLENLPTRAGFTQAGDLNGSFIVAGGDPNSLSDPMPSGIGRAAVELGPSRDGPPGDDIEVAEDSSGVDPTTRLAIPGLERFYAHIDPPPDNDSGLLDRRIEGSYSLSGAPNPLDANIDLETVDGDADGVPHQVSVLLEPDNRVPDAGPGKPWIDYQADQSLDRVEIDVLDDFWLYIEDLPSDVGFTHAGDLDDVFAVTLGNPDNLTDPLPSPITDVAVEIGDHRGGTPTRSVEFSETADTYRLAVPGFDHLDVRIAAPQNGPLSRRIHGFYHLSGAPEPLSATIETTDVEGTLTGMPHEVSATLEPDNRRPDANADQPWVEYRADRSLDEIEIDVLDEFWGYIEDLPEDVGFTQAGSFEDTFVVTLGDPDDLTNPLPSPMTKATVEIGDHRSGIPANELVVHETGGPPDTTYKLGVPGLDHLDVRLDPQPAGGNLMDRYIDGAYSVSGAPDPLEGDIDTETAIGSAVGLPHQVSVLFDPANRVTDAGVDSPWIDYRADRALDEFTLDIIDKFRFRVDDLPDAVGFTHAGRFDETLLVELGDPDDLTKSLPTAITSVAVEIGEHRNWTPSNNPEISQTANSTETWELAVPGLDFLETRLETPPEDDADLFDRPVLVDVRLGGASRPIDGVIDIDNIEGFSGGGTLSSVPSAVRFWSDPGDEHDIVLNFGNERLEGLDVTFNREPDEVPEGDGIPYNRFEALIHWLSSLRVELNRRSDGTITAGRIGAVEDISEPIAGGLGLLTAALDADQHADPVMNRQPELRFEQEELDADRLLVGAVDVGRVEAELLENGISLDIKRVLSPYRPEAHEVLRETEDYSLAVIRAVGGENAESTRTLVHAGHLPQRLQTTIEAGDDDLHVSTRGELKRVKLLHLDDPISREGPDWTASELRVDAAVPTIPDDLTLLVDEQTTIDVSEAMRADIELRDPSGLGDGEDRHIDSRLAIPKGETRLTTGDESMSVDAGEGYGVTGRVALSRELDDLRAVRATPQVFDYSDTQADGKSERVTTTARIYGLQSFEVATGPVYRNGEGLNRRGSDIALSAGLDSERPNRGFRIATFGSDEPERPPRWQSRTRLAEVSDNLNVRMKDGVEPGQSYVSATSESGVLAAEGDIWAEPAEIPHDGPAEGDLVGVGRVEAVIETLPIELTLVGLPFDDAPGETDPSERDGYLESEGEFTSSGQLFEVRGDLRLRDVIQMGWSVSDGDDDRWARNELACLDIASDTGGQVWIRQNETREVEFENMDAELNIMIDDSTRVTLDAYNYVSDTTRSNKPTEWQTFNDDWNAAARLQLDNFAGWIQVVQSASPTDDEVESGDWWLRSVGDMKLLPADVSVGSTSGPWLSKFPLDDVCEEDD